MKTMPRLRMGEEYDKEALVHLNKTIEFEELAATATILLDRERYGEKARQERDAAIESLEQAKIASGPESSEGMRNASYEFPI